MTLPSGPIPGVNTLTSASAIDPTGAGPFTFETVSPNADLPFVPVGGSVFIESANDPNIWMWARVISYDDVSDPNLLVVDKNLTRATVSATNDAWSIFVLDGAPAPTPTSMTDADITVTDQTRVVILTVPLTADRILTLSDGATLLGGERLLIIDGTAAGGVSLGKRIIVNNHLGVEVANLFSAFQSLSLIWNEVTMMWVVYNAEGYFASAEAGGVPLIIQELDNSATSGPIVSHGKISASPAAFDGLGVYDFTGMNSNAEEIVYAYFNAYIIDPTDATEDGGLLVVTIVGGILTTQIDISAGLVIGGATGGAKGTGTVNATGYYVNGVAVINGPVLLASGAASGATLDLVLTAYTAYAKLVIELINLIPATDNVNLLTRVSTDGGATYDNGATNYKYGLTTVNDTDGPAAVQSTGASSIALTGAAATANSIGNGASEGGSFTVELPGQTNTAIKPRMRFRGSFYSANDHICDVDGSGLRNAAQDTDALRFLFSSGNITSGTYRVWGYS